MFNHEHKFMLDYVIVYHGITDENNVFLHFVVWVFIEKRIAEIFDGLTFSNQLVLVREIHSLSRFFNNSINAKQKISLI